MERSAFLLLRPYWPFLPGVEAFTAAAAREAAEVTFRGESEVAVASRMWLDDLTKPASPIQWLEQPHGANVIRLPGASSLEADGAITEVPGVVCAMRSADCLPIFFAAGDGAVVGIAHAGWKGLRDGVIEATFAGLKHSPGDVYAWLGPAISGVHYEIGEDVRQEFGARAHVTDDVFSPTLPGKYTMDLYRMARNILRHVGLPDANVSGGEFCTYSDHRLQSSRRDGKLAGRMASVIWRKT